jgi:hypothetical protein
LAAATVQTEKDELTSQIADLKEKKTSFQDLDEETSEEPASLDKNEKPIKELLKTTRAINFDPDEIETVFKNPTTFVFERNNSAVKLQLNKKTVLIPEVTILAPEPVPAIASLFVYRTDVDPDQKEKNEAAQAKAEKYAADKKVRDEKYAADKKVRDERYQADTKLRKEREHEKDMQRLKDKGEIDVTKIKSDMQLRLKDKEIEAKVKQIRSEHRSRIEMSEMQYRQEMRKYSAQTAEAKRKNSAEAKMELARINADKKRSEAQYKSEVNKLKTEMIEKIEKIKPGAGKMESEPTDMTTETTGERPTNKRTDVVPSNATRKNSNEMKPLNGSKNTKKIPNKQSVLIKKNGKFKRYDVTTTNTEMIIEASPV